MVNQKLLVTYAEMTYDESVISGGSHQKVINSVMAEQIIVLDCKMVSNSEGERYLLRTAPLSDDSRNVIRRLNSRGNIQIFWESY